MISVTLDVLVGIQEDFSVVNLHIHFVTLLPFSDMLAASIAIVRTGGCTSNVE